MKKLWTFIFLFSFFYVQSPAPLGIKNLGNTCYMNALLQCLIASEKFVTLMKNINFASVTDEKTKNLGNTFKNFVIQHAADKTINEPTDPQPFAACVNMQRLFPGDVINNQQDSDELFIKLIRLLGEEKKDLLDFFTIKSEMSLTPACLQGKEGAFTDTEEEQEDIVLRLPLSADSLDDCIKNFFGKKKSDIYCNNCRQQACVDQEIFITHYPELLVILLGRRDEKGKKITKKITINPNNSLIGSYEYKLIGCVFHAGTGTGGHYTAVINKDSAWYECSDTYVKHLTLVEAQKILNGENTESYLLFFEKVKEVQLHAQKIQDITNLLMQTQNYIRGLYVNTSLFAFK